MRCKGGWRVRDDSPVWSLGEWSYYNWRKQCRMDKSGKDVRSFLTASSVQFSSVAESCPTLWDPMDWSTPDFSVHHQLLSLLELMSIELAMPSNHLILCRPLLLLPSILPSIKIFSNESVLCIRWPKYWSFSVSISSSNEYSGLISLRIDWLDLLAVQRTLKSLLQHHSSKASILQHSAFFIVQLLHPYTTTGIFKYAI